MTYKGVGLVLDNFRSVLNDYSLDIQDIVRSAILDGVDISMYIDDCRCNPLRLDQIRLSIKEGLDRSLLSIKDGNCLYRIRKLSPDAMKVVAYHLETEVLNAESLELLIDWAGKGYNLKKIKISLVPLNLRNVFERGFMMGLDMSVFNTGQNLSDEFISNCIVILSQNHKKDVGLLVKNADKWDAGCIKLLAQYSLSVDDSKWGLLFKEIDYSIKKSTLKLLISLVRNGVNIKEIVSRGATDECIEIILKAYEEGLDYNLLIGLSGEVDAVTTEYHKMLFSKNKRISGRLRK